MVHAEAEWGTLTEATTGTTGSDSDTVVLDNVCRFFRRRNGTVVRALAGISLSVAEGEIVVLLGPSGCGKTTLLRCIAGLERPDSGTIDICGSRVFDGDRRVSVPPNARNLNMMFQSYALWPHMTVAQNVAFPLRSRHVPKADIRDRVGQILELTGVSELSSQHPSQLSGGQQQRVALARALVHGDRLILFDEPLSNVDAKLREQLRFELLEMHRRLGFSAIYVTHDQQEAIELADRVVVLDTGTVAQVAPPAEVYERPANQYVANFIGTANELSGTVHSIGVDETVIETAIGVIRSGIALSGCRVGERVVVVWRPERGEIVADGPPTFNTWTGRVHASVFAGGHTKVLVDIGGNQLRFLRSGTPRDKPDAPITVHVPPEHVLVFRDSAKSNGCATV